MKLFKKDLKISKKSILISAIIIILLGVPALAYLWITNQENTEAWYDSNWMYRRAVTIGYSGQQEMFYDFLYIVDTASLVSSGKLKADCTDLRFVDSDDSTLLNYWIESGCNTSQTNIWIQIPYINDIKTIYIYYGNPTALPGEISWAGNFLMLSNTSCPSDWSSESNFDAKFPYGSNTYGQQEGLNTHDHAISLTSSTSSTTSLVPSGSSSNTPSLASHTHNTSISSLQESPEPEILPPYIHMFFCKKNKLDIHTNFVTNFSTTTLPSGWSRFSQLDNRLPIGATTYGSTGGSTTHTHSTSGILSSSVTTYNAPNSNTSSGSTVGVSNHTHYVSQATIDGTSHMPPYYTTNYGISTTDSPAKDNMLTMVTQLPPLGWTLFEELNGKFALGSSTPGDTGGSLTHTHPVQIILSEPKESTTFTYSTTGGTNIQAAGQNHTHSFTESTTSASNIPPSITVIYAQRKSSVATFTGFEETEEIQLEESGEGEMTMMGGSMNTPPDAPSLLETESQSNPLKVTTLTPGFTAICSDPDGDTCTSYQVRVFEPGWPSPTVKWDSGKTAFALPPLSGSRSPSITYAGASLILDGKTYYWDIKFWDSNEEESPWSITAQFIMSGPPSEPTDPRIDLSNPSVPLFSALHTDPNQDSAGNYEIHVNSNDTFTGTVLWNSGKQIMTSTAHNTRSPNISYAGTTLTGSGNTYYWRIRFWDTDDNVSGWSSTSTFLDLVPYFRIGGIKLEGININ